MGQTEKIIVERIKQHDSWMRVWNPSLLCQSAYPGHPEPTTLRRTYRLIDRTNIVPKAITQDEFLENCPSHAVRQQTKGAIDRALKNRFQVSIVQLREVRMGVWALCWNNLRLAKHWIWISEIHDLQRALARPVESMILSHRLPCCLMSQRKVPLI